MALIAFAWCIWTLFLRFRVAGNSTALLYLVSMVPGQAPLLFLSRFFFLFSSSLSSWSLLAVLRVFMPFLMIQMSPWKGKNTGHGWWGQSSAFMTDQGLDNWLRCQHKGFSLILMQIKAEFSLTSRFWDTIMIFRNTTYVECIAVNPLSAWWM